MAKRKYVRKKPFNPKCLENLRPPVQPGDPGRNPEGINRRRPLSDAALQTSQEPVPDALRVKINRSLGKDTLPPGVTWAQAWGIRMNLNVLIKGDVRAGELLLMAIEGRPNQRIELTGGGGAPLAAPSFTIVPAAVPTPATNDDPSPVAAASPDPAAAIPNRIPA